MEDGSRAFSIFDPLTSFYRIWRVLAHRDDDRANQRRRQQQADDFERQDVLGHQQVPDVFDRGFRRRRRFLGQARAVQRRPAERGEDDGGNHNAGEPAGRQNGLVRRRITARQQNREHDEDGNRADIDQNLGEADELRVERQVKRRQPGQRHHQRQRAMHQIAQAHRRRRGKERHNCNDDEGQRHG